MFARVIPLLSSLLSTAPNEDPRLRGAKSLPRIAQLVGFEPSFNADLSYSGVPGFLASALVHRGV